ncbi:hypothetical protein [Vibrio tetraodonis]|uniref:hypothetical protein n=1 Tax=Vibrio tetraodonis TaxID=2231647 RepID=UPI000E0BD1F0|nr:hypothetical protein [Vibrio tetraodonis]
MTIHIIHFNNYFGQSLPTENSLDIDLIKNKLEGYGFNVKLIDIIDIANKKITIDPDDYYIIGSHQNPSVKKIVDGVVSIKLRDINLIPKFYHVLAHENKAIQAMLNSELNLGLLEQLVSICSKGDMISDYDASKVNKFVSGSGSSGVFVPNLGETYTKYINKVFWRATNISDLIEFIKFRVLGVFFKRTKENIDYNKSYYTLVQQEKIKSPGFDYKALVYFDRIYLLKRYVRNNDFRSSGSGNFEFVESINKELLDFILDLREKLDVPYVSLDIIDNEGMLNCIEYQCVHFGPYTQMFANVLFHKEGESWRKLERKASVEEEMAYAIDRYIRN